MGQWGNVDPYYATPSLLHGSEGASQRVLGAYISRGEGVDGWQREVFETADANEEEFVLVFIVPVKYGIGAFCRGDGSHFNDSRVPISHLTTWQNKGVRAHYTHARTHARTHTTRTHTTRTHAHYTHARHTYAHYTHARTHIFVRTRRSSQGATCVHTCNGLWMVRCIASNVQRPGTHTCARSNTKKHEGIARVKVQQAEGQRGQQARRLE